MRKKTQKVTNFLEELHKFITGNPQFRKKTRSKSETQIQAELRPLILDYLKKYFKKEGYRDFEGKAFKSFYWEGQEGKFGKARHPTFGARNYPDFIITAPYLVAIEYKQSPYGSTVKHGIGQSIMHTMTEDFEFVYYLFHDQSKEKNIEKSLKEEKEQRIIKELWQRFNLFIRFV